MAERVIINILYFINAAIWSSIAGLWYVFARIEVTLPSVVLFGIALMAVYFCYIHKPKMLIGFAVVSLVPIGIYLLATPSVFAMIGVLNIAGLLFGFAVLVSDTKEYVHEGS